jgi:hypothetical protein
MRVIRGISLFNKDGGGEPSFKLFERKETGPGHFSERSPMSGGKPNTDSEPQEQELHKEASVFSLL